MGFAELGFQTLAKSGVYISPSFILVYVHGFALTECVYMCIYCTLTYCTVSGLYTSVYTCRYYSTVILCGD